MSVTSSTVDRVVELLSRGDRYQRVTGPFKVGQISMPFSFETVLLGPCDGDGMVLIEYCSGRSMLGLLNMVQALHAALSRAGSVRSLSLILIDLRGEPGVVEQLRGMARILEVSSADVSTDDQLREVIAVLLPLPVPGTATMPRGEELFMENADSELTEPMQALVQAWDQSPDQLERLFLNMVENVIRLEEGEQS